MSRAQCTALVLATLAMFAFANLRNPLINDDGVLYLLLAEHIGNGGLAAAFGVFDRPLYSSLIAGVHALSGLGLHNSARLLDAVLACALVLGFTTFCRLLYRDAGILPWAALLLLLQPRLNNYFAFVIRDLGFWALLFASFCLLLREIETPRLANRLLWALSMLLAAAFKPEALVFGVLPLALLAVPGRPLRARWASALGAPAVLGIALGVLALLGATRAAELPAALRELPELPLDLAQDITAAFRAASERYATTVLDPYSRDVAALSLASGLLGILVLKFINTLGLVRLVLFFHGLRRAALPADNRVPYALMLGCALLLPVLFLAYRQFLDSRYMMLLSLLALAPAARGLQLIAARATRLGHRPLFLGALAVVIVTDFSAGLNRPKPYLRECAAWMEQEIPRGARVFSNDKRLLGLSGGSIDLQEVQGATQAIRAGNAPLAGVAYWIIHVRHDEQELLESLEAYRDFLVPLRRFASERGDLILVYTPVQSATG